MGFGGFKVEYFGVPPLKRPGVVAGGAANLADLQAPGLWAVALVIIGFRFLGTPAKLLPEVRLIKGNFASKLKEGGSA